ncbi:unnamed protein product [Didymodactylos carnosus]|uniref:Uncharacterized protein n=1 Tax=Didymodactylos carnosus TaxID=1234261 RepID=A0A8S2PFB1_9BILA|nr:unnamed protein product [Didymodactylos carnosus]CAF4051750.1 unnamed protein product [Didymodactylos carnosus]
MLTLDSIPKVIGHIRIQNIFARPTDITLKKTDLFRITPLPYFAQRNKAVMATGLPHYVALSTDNSSSEWNEHSDRRCTKDTHSLICSLPTVEHIRVKNPCIRSIMFDENDNVIKTGFKQKIDTHTPYIARLTSSVWIASAYVPTKRSSGEQAKMSLQK